VRRAAAALACGTTIAVIAGLTRSPALLALGIGLWMLTGVAAVTVAAAIRWVDVERTVTVSEVQEDGVVRARLTLHGARWLPVRVEVERDPGGWTAIALGGTSVELTVGRPGAYWLAPARVRRRDVVGLFRRQTLVGEPEPLLLLPAPRCDALPGAGDHGVVGDPDLAGLTTYVPGMPLARMHWPALARGAEPQVRDLARSPERLPLIVVDTGGTPRPEALDWVARTAAGRILTLARSGGCRVLLPGETRPTSVIGAGQAWRTVHRRLAMLRDSVTLGASPRFASGAAIIVQASTAPKALPSPPPLPHGVVPAP
jgi:uncharacterized protein (DUF58 family)